jgi:hypothetical protein
MTTFSPWAFVAVRVVSSAEHFGTFVTCPFKKDKTFEDKCKEGESVDLLE